MKLKLRSHHKHNSAPPEVHAYQFIYSGQAVEALAEPLNAYRYTIDTG